MTDQTTDLESLNDRMVERLCSVGTPRGPVGTIQSVYQRRGRVRGVYGAKVLMLESCATRYVDLGEVYVR